MSLILLLLASWSGVTVSQEEDTSFVGLIKSDSAGVAYDASSLDYPITRPLARVSARIAANYAPDDLHVLVKGCKDFVVGRDWGAVERSIMIFGLVKEKRALDYLWSVFYQGATPDEVKTIAIETIARIDPDIETLTKIIAASSGSSSIYELFALALATEKTKRRCYIVEYLRVLNSLYAINRNITDDPSYAKYFAFGWSYKKLSQWLGISEMASPEDILEYAYYRLPSLNFNRDKKFWAPMKFVGKDNTGPEVMLNTVRIEELRREASAAVNRQDVGSAFELMTRLAQLGGGLQSSTIISKSILNDRFTVSAERERGPGALNELFLLCERIGPAAVPGIMDLVVLSDNETKIERALESLVVILGRSATVRLCSGEFFGKLVLSSKTGAAVKRVLLTDQPKK